MRLFHLSIDSYAEGDAALAAALDDMDGRLDTLLQLHPGHLRRARRPRPRAAGRRGWR
ncbi:MAG: hypothetical protein R2699_03370 [Acidimicrobiales bacterium]